MPPAAAQPTVRFDPWKGGRNARAITLTYLLALGLVATIAITSHVVTARIVSQQASTARIINLAGRQRMLSQRITRVAEEIAAGTTDPVTGGQIVLASANGIEQAEAALTHGDIALGIPPPATAAVRALYAEPPFQLQTRLHEFLASARQVATHPGLRNSDPALRSMVTTLEISLLPGLEHAVWQYQQDSETGIVHLQHVLSTLTFTMLAVLALEAILIYRPLFHRLTHAIQQLLQAATTDMLTRVLNRGAFLQHAEAELNRARHSGVSTALIVANLDAFRQVNDRYGQAAGDLALRHFGAIAQSNLRSNDRIGRLGGEEFAILLCDTPLEGAVLAAERIRERLAGSTAALMPDNRRVFITCSFGVTVTAPGEDLTSLFARADAQLRRAKQEGRNRVESAAPAGSASQAHTPRVTLEQQVAA